MGRPPLASATTTDRLAELVAMGKVGAAAPSHYSLMGYILEPQELLEESVLAIVAHLRQEEVDAVVLVPA